ncbi:MAG: prephenate dehydrogenase [Spirochaetia bacterium]|nr:prephenate dehydrogenase [Spirochaetota bacterium]MCX8096010.1 prephenate dehydrogenase [Spirochaetota bacterium]MDW8111805.1 prephenate dehydrogenase [Spirochaetia bacterium]
MVDRLAIAGLGLIGGSIAIAVKNKYPNSKIVGITRNIESVRKNNFSKYFDLLLDYSELVETRNIDFCVICSPVSTIPEVFRTLKSYFGVRTIFTDVGSVKEWIVKEINDTSFIGSHPMAGSEKSGIENADPNIFLNATCVVTPKNNSEEQIKIVSEFWNNLDMNVILLSPEVHDKIVSQTSHLVHLVSFALSKLLSQSEFSKDMFYGIFGKGLIDTTRVSKSDPHLWIDIFKRNKNNLIDALEDFISVIRTFRDYVKVENWDTLLESLMKAKNFRDSIK